MITRVRARLNSLAKKMEARGELQDERTAHTVCLVSVVLLLPCLARLHSSQLLLLAFLGVAYALLVLPSLFPPDHFVVHIYSVLQYTTRNFVRHHLNQAKEMAREWSQVGQKVIRCAMDRLDRWETCFLKMQNIANMINQLVFFILCERVLVPGQRMTGLYSLMFYNVMAYLVAYVKELVQKEDWSPYVTMTRNSDIKHLAMSTTKIVLEWTKAVTFVTTLVFMLLVFGLEQGLHQYHPSWAYLGLTWPYYVATERTFSEGFPALLALLHLERLESLEEFWAPVLLRVSTSTLSLLLALPLLPLGHPRLLLLVLYANVYLPHKEMASTTLRQLRQQRALLSPYRNATQQELEEHDDVCPVCLCPMTLARITPCHHLFHADCLRLCLQASDQCPLCKRLLKFH